MRLLALPLLAACAAPAPFAELSEQGADRYLGAAAPEDVLENDEGEVVHTFPVGDDTPICMEGGPFRVSTLDRGSSSTVIFLQGGGACWSDLCLAVVDAPPGVPPLNLLDAGIGTNPVKDWNVVYAPYCDGSLFAGDADIDADEDGTIDRTQRGLRNLSATLDVAKATFPDTERLLFAGSSGGAYGTLITTPLVRMAFPQVELLVMNDSGPGIAKEAEQGFLDRIIREFHAEALVPPSCEGCLDGGHLTPLLGWQLDQDPTLRIGVYSSKRDFVLSRMFLAILPEEFEPPMLRETGRLEADYPGRFERFVTEGEGHTSLVGSIEGVLGDLGKEFESFSTFVQLGSLEGTAVEGVTMAEWLRRMIADDGWESLVEEPATDGTGDGS